MLFLRSWTCKVCNAWNPNWSLFWLNRTFFWNAVVQHPKNSGPSFTGLQGFGISGCLFSCFDQNSPITMDRRGTTFHHLQGWISMFSTFDPKKWALNQSMKLTQGGPLVASEHVFFHVSRFLTGAKRQVWTRYQFQGGCLICWITALAKKSNYSWRYLYDVPWIYPGY